MSRIYQWEVTGTAAVAVSGAATALHDWTGSTASYPVELLFVCLTFLMPVNGIADCFVLVMVNRELRAPLELPTFENI